MCGDCSRGWDAMLAVDLAVKLVPHSSFFCLSGAFVTGQEQMPHSTKGALRGAPDFCYPETLLQGEHVGGDGADLLGAELAGEGGHLVLTLGYEVADPRCAHLLDLGSVDRLYAQGGDDLRAVGTVAADTLGLVDGSAVGGKERSGQGGGGDNSEHFIHGFSCIS